MKRTTLLVAVLLAVAALPASAQFQNYHYNTNINCSDCHSMHGSAGDNLVDGVQVTATTGTANRRSHFHPGGGPFAKLLKGNNSAVCIACHDGVSTIPDVVETNTSAGIIKRSAGFLDTDALGGGHKIGSTVAPPGYNSAAAISTWYTTNYGTIGLQCTSCHNPHGRATWRNLGPDSMATQLAGNFANVAPTVLKIGAFPGTPTDDVILVGKTTHTFDGAAANLNSYYNEDAVTYAKSGTYTVDSIASNNRMDQFCGTCHGRFHGASKTTPTGAAPYLSVNDGTNFVRHPTSTVAVSALNTGATYQTNHADAFNNLKLYQAAGTQAIGDSPGCLTCHKAHGNGNPFALIYPSNTGADTSENGNGTTVRDLCKACHNQGGDF